MDPSYPQYTSQQSRQYPSSTSSASAGQQQQHQQQRQQQQQQHQAGGPGIPGYPYGGQPGYGGGSYGYPAPPAFSSSGVMIYPAGPRSVSGQAPGEPQSQSTPSGSEKRKRKSTGGSAGRRREGESTSDEDGGSVGDTRAQQRALAEAKKRTKTQRACDSCRSRKIRCDVLGEAEPPLCQHCKQYGFECTFFLPITETRFKKKRLEEEAAERAEAERKTTASPRTESSVWGPTSPTHLLHSTASISSRIYENWDKRYHHSFEVSDNGDGIVVAPHRSSTPDEHTHAPPKPVDLRLDKELLERLVNAYFTDLAPLLPVVTKAEFIAGGSPPPILLYSMCLVAAARRDVPQSVFDSLRHAVNHLIKQDDVLSNASIVHVQSLLILCMMADVHSPYVPQALSCLWIRLGAAIRMAQDLGLHRAESVKQDIELRRRLWGVCVVSDRWTALAYGHPFMIDVQDCDARLPSSGSASDQYLDQLVRLSLILGRVLKTIYSPSGLAMADDDGLRALLNDIIAWRERLPDTLKFRGPDTPRPAGLLHLLYSCLNMIFWRVFMRISYSCPSHLKFALTINDWSALLSLTNDAIDWLDRHDTVYDQWLLISYSTTSCALVQYHTWVRRQDAEAVAKLRTLRDFVRRWESSLSPDHMSARRKTAEIITLLFGATQGPQMPFEPPALNPTPGATINKPIEGLEFRRDTSRPGGGVFVARGVSTPDTPDDPDREGELLDENSHPRPISASAPNTPNAQTPDSVMAAPTLDSTRVMPSHAGRTGSLPTLAPAPAPAISVPDLQRLGVPGIHPPPPPPQSVMDFSSGNMSFSPFANVNPAMDDGQFDQVQLMNALDAPTEGHLAQLAMADTGFLEGMPTTAMFDWVQWDSFFARLPPVNDPQYGFQPPPSGPMDGMYGPPSGQNHM